MSKSENYFSKTTFNTSLIKLMFSQFSRSTSLIVQSSETSGRALRTLFGCHDNQVPVLRIGRVVLEEEWTNVSLLAPILNPFHSLKVVCEPFVNLFVSNRAKYFYVIFLKQKKLLQSSRVTTVFCSSRATAEA